jgi:hypothetical protein
VELSLVGSLVDILLASLPHYADDEVLSYANPVPANKAR